MRWLLPLMLSATALAGCNPITQSAAQNTLQSSRAQHLVGQTKYVREFSLINICDQPGPPIGSARKCFYPKDGQRIEAIEAATDPNFGNSIKIRTADGREGWIPIFDFEGASDLDWKTEETAKKAKAKADCDRRGGVNIGMTKAQVYASCWGKPEKINVTTTAGGDHEQLVYGYSYVYLRGGVVTSIQTSRRD